MSFAIFSCGHSLRNAIDTYSHKKLNIFLFILVWMRKGVHHHKKAMQKIIGKFLADYIYYWHVNGYYHQSNIIAHTFFSQQLNLHMMQWEKMICCIVKSVVKYEILSGNLLLLVHTKVRNPNPKFKNWFKYSCIQHRLGD